MKPVLTIRDLILEAEAFCERLSEENHTELIGVTDGKAVGTYVEHRFQTYLDRMYDVEIGSSAKGIDLPGEDILTDIKVTSITQPQSSCPFRNARQKIFGLGYNLLVFVYDKHDTPNSCTLTFTPVSYTHLESVIVTHPANCLLGHVLKHLGRLFHRNLDLSIFPDRRCAYLTA